MDAGRLEYIRSNGCGWEPAVVVVIELVGTGKLQVVTMIYCCCGVDRRGLHNGVCVGRVVLHVAAGFIESMEENVDGLEVCRIVVMFIPLLPG